MSPPYWFAQEDAAEVVPPPAEDAKPSTEALAEEATAPAATPEATPAATPAVAVTQALPAMLQLISNRSLSEGWPEEKTKEEINKLVAENCVVMAAKASADKDNVKSQQWHPGKLVRQEGANFSF